MASETRLRACPQDPPETLISEGDEVRLHDGREGVIERIDLALRPYADPAAETSFAQVPACEACQFFAVSLTGGHWAYGREIAEVREKVEAI